MAKSGTKAERRRKPYYRDEKYWASKNEYDDEKRKEREKAEKEKEKAEEKK